MKALCSTEGLSKALRESPVDYKTSLTGSDTVLTLGDMYATDVLILLLWRPVMAGWLVRLEANPIAF